VKIITNQEHHLPPAIVSEINTEDPDMAIQRNPNDPYRSNIVGGGIDPATLDTELQVDPELAEGPASGGRIAVFAVAVALVLGAVFYGLNNSSVSPAGTTTAQNTAQSSPPPAPTGMRDVTPRMNAQPGVTTGAAPSSAPTGSDLNRSGNPPTTDSAPTK
jgi:hypothetical protein